MTTLRNGLIMGMSVSSLSECQLENKDRDRLPLWVFQSVGRLALAGNPLSAEPTD